MMRTMNERARARSQWPGKVLRLEDEDGGALAPAGTSPAELVASVWSLTLDAWALSGRPLPTYTRAEMPGRVVRGRGPT